jgi:hypothetical protein
MTLLYGELMVSSTTTKANPMKRRRHLAERELSFRVHLATLVARAVRL